MKIIVCGPPHSGKSVFLGGLTECLPVQSRYLFRACPDGEGTWTYKTPECVLFRRKGKFTSEICTWYEKVLSAKELAPITLVDVGGRMTVENSRIFSHCDAAIILSSCENAITEWRAFCKNAGLTVIAEVHSDYNAEKDTVSTLTVHHLERGEDVSNRPVIQKIAVRLLDMTANKSELSEKRAENMVNKIEISELATKLGKSEKMITLPNGRVINTIQWNGGDLKTVAKILHGADKASEVQINGAAPAWLIAALCHECHPSVALVNSPDGYVRVECQKPSRNTSGENLEWSTVSKDGVITVKVQQIDPSIPLNPSDLAKWCPPEVPFNTTVVLSGRMPNWGMAAIAMAYHGYCKAVALFQPGVGATVAITHSPSVELGSILK